MSEYLVEISVIIPVYNGEKFIQSAYENILKQNLESFEIIFVDNNSTDQSVAIIEELSQVDSRVILTTEKTQGAGAARNTGFIMAKGKYIYFYDVDDLIYPEAIKTLKSILEQNPDLDSIFGNTIKGYENRELETIKENQLQNLPVDKSATWPLKWITNQTTIPGTAAFLHRSNSFIDNRPFNEKLLVGEDVFFHITWGLDKNLGYIDIPIYYYYRHSESTVSSQNLKVSHRINTYWEQYIKAYLPYMLNHKVPQAFQKELMRNILGAMGKILAITKGMKNRFSTFSELKQQISPFNLPRDLRIWLNLIAISGSLKAYKFYYFYILPEYLDSQYSKENKS